MKKYNALYFINKFEAIPESKWCTDRFQNGETFCALGHCGSTYSNHSSPIESFKLLTLFRAYSFSVTKINDGEYDTWNIIDTTMFGKTPKERILNALYLINAMEECE